MDTIDVKPCLDGDRVQPGWIYVSKSRKIVEPQEELAYEKFAHPEPIVKLLEINYLNSSFKYSPHRELWVEDIKKLNCNESFCLFACSILKIEEAFPSEVEQCHRNFEYISKLYSGYAIPLLVIFDKKEPIGFQDINKHFMNLLRHIDTDCSFSVKKVIIYNQNLRRFHYGSLTQGLNSAIYKVTIAEETVFDPLLCVVKKVNEGIQNESKKFCLNQSLLQKINIFTPGRKETRVLGGQEKVAVMNCAYYFQNKSIKAATLTHAYLIAQPHDHFAKLHNGNKHGNASNLEDNGKKNNMKWKEYNTSFFDASTMEGGLDSSLHTFENENKCEAAYDRNKIYPLENKSTTQESDLKHLSDLKHNLSQNPSLSSKGKKENNCNVHSGDECHSNCAENMLYSPTKNEQKMKTFHQSPNNCHKNYMQLKVTCSNEKQENKTFRSVNIPTFTSEVKVHGKQNTIEMQQLYDELTNLMPPFESVEKCEKQKNYCFLKSKTNKRKNDNHLTEECDRKRTCLSSQSEKEVTLLQLPVNELKAKFNCKVYSLTKTEQDNDHKCLFLFGSVDSFHQVNFINLIWKYHCEKNASTFLPVIATSSLTDSVFLYKFLNIDDSLDVTIVFTPVLTDDTFINLKTILEEGSIQIHALGLMLDAKSASLNSAEQNILAYIRSAFGEVGYQHLMTILINSEFERNFPCVEEMQTHGIKPTSVLTLRAFSLEKVDDLSKGIIDQNLKKIRKCLKTLNKLPCLSVKSLKLAQEQAFAKHCLNDFETKLDQKLHDFWNANFNKNTVSSFADADVNAAKEIWNLLKIVCCMTSKEISEQHYIANFADRISKLGSITKKQNDIFLSLILLDSERSFTIAVKSILDYQMNLFKHFFTTNEIETPTLTALPKSQKIPLVCISCNDIHLATRKCEASYSSSFVKFVCDNCKCGSEKHFLWSSSNSISLQKLFAEQAKSSIFNLYDELPHCAGKYKSEIKNILLNIFPEYSPLIDKM